MQPHMENPAVAGRVPMTDLAGASIGSDNAKLLRLFQSHKSRRLAPPQAETAIAAAFARALARQEEVRR
jgi:hypothetical protein